MIFIALVFPSDSTGQGIDSLFAADTDADVSIARPEGGFRLVLFFGVISSRV